MKAHILLFIFSIFTQLSFGGVSEIAENEGVFRFSDGSSIYSFHKDGSFDLNPCGMSGRMIKGRWKEVDGFIQVEGEWSWLNGISKPGDLRIMRLRVDTAPSWEQGTAEIKKHSVSTVYFTIESIHKQGI